jgi:hypothetical protein
MKKCTLARIAIVVLFAGCGAGEYSNSNSNNGAPGAGSVASRDEVVTTVQAAACGTGGTGGTTTAPAPAPAPAPEPGSWTDGPGACPAGANRVDISSLSALQDATRGEGSRAGDPAGTCYFIHNGTYVQSGSTLPVYVTKGGDSATSRRTFVGESRAGVVIRGRGSIADGVSHVRFSNLTFNLTGYSQSGSFSTMTLNAASDLAFDHMTFTGDCATGYMGGAVEVDGATSVVVESSIIEKWRRSPRPRHLPRER